MKRYWVVAVDAALVLINIFAALFLADGWWALLSVVAVVVIGAIGIATFRSIRSELRDKETGVTSSPSYHNGGYIYHTPATWITSTTPSVSFTPTPAPTQPPVKAGDFKGVPFDLAIGEVYGMRMWHMDQYGRLRARNWTADPWRPGVNVAKCRAKDDSYAAMMRQVSRYYSYPTIRASEVEQEPESKPTHDAPAEDCQCGFYAYTDSLHAETMPYKKDGESVVLGIIKGTGRTLVGTKGFRCEKAEIIAFRDPTRGGTKNDPWRQKQLANLKRVYPDVPILPSRAALLEFAPLTDTMPDPSTDEFWEMT